jgi:UDP-N-acetylmuramyl tripeptide synthase
MTDRHFAYTVILQAPIREDDAEAIKQAILMVKGVADVIPQTATAETYFAVETARRELEEKIWKALRKDNAG